MPRIGGKKVEGRSHHYSFGYKRPRCRATGNSGAIPCNINRAGSSSDGCWNLQPSRQEPQSSRAVKDDWKAGGHDLRSQNCSVKSNHSALEEKVHDSRSLYHLGYDAKSSIQARSREKGTFLNRMKKLSPYEAKSQLLSRAILKEGPAQTLCISIRSLWLLEHTLALSRFDVVLVNCYGGVDNAVLEEGPLTHTNAQLSSPLDALMSFMTFFGTSGCFSCGLLRSRMRAISRLFR